MRPIVILMTAMGLALAGGTRADSPPGAPATAPDPAVLSLKARLQAMGERDQAGRNRLLERAQRDGLPQNAPQYADLRKRQRGIDFRNQGELDEVVKRFGWPGVDRVGPVAAEAAFDVVLHAHLDYQKKYLPLIRAAVVARQASADNLALLEDRVRASDQPPH
jgi:hypothetical protein